ncbi:MAG: sugar-transfer associated ATP-grasp domain-containing protein, partial [Wenzhouxiangellaceae bacterium]
EILPQTQSLAKFHPHSLNTFRVITLRLGREIHVLSALIKFGVVGSFIDNTSNGGIWCGIDKDGKLCPYEAPIRLHGKRLHL